ncbi:MAG: hypothetical protein ACREXW_02825 [Gammaproteobacteria bacterium]
MTARFASPPRVPAVYTRVNGMWLSRVGVAAVSTPIGAAFTALALDYNRSFLAIRLNGSSNCDLSATTVQ